MSIFRQVVGQKSAAFLTNFARWFQNRYRSFLCEEDLYLKELVRCLHLNPIRAKMVKGVRELKSYPYSGHGVLMGKVKSTGRIRSMY
jgi:hypothetical protein